MKILIIENEIYLAQSITTKLSQFGFVCEIVSSIDEALKFESMDIILLSSNIPGQNFYPVIEKFKSSITVLIVILNLPFSSSPVSLFLFSFLIM